jgi:hypothetical protein
MQRFTEFNVLFSKSKDKALAELGIETTAEDYLDKCSIDLNQVESFCKCTELFEGTELIRVQLKSGDVWTVQYNYEDFKTILI